MPRLLRGHRTEIDALVAEQMAELAWPGKLFNAMSLFPA